MDSYVKKAIKDMLPENLLSCYHSLRYKQLLRYNQRGNLTFEEAEKLISTRYIDREGRELNWNQPETYTEKISVVKLYGANQIKTKLADKFLVREWIKNRIGEKYLIPLIGTYSTFTEIDFEKLPERFVMKCNHDCGSVIICKKKNNINNHFWSELQKRYEFHCKRNFAYNGFEMHYKFISPKILVENYIGENDAEIIDYRFQSFNGEPYYCWVDTNSLTDHRRNIYDLDWNLQPFQVSYGNSLQEVAKPQEYELMKNIATTLCKGFDHVRVDLYAVNGKVYFGEMTFTTQSGLSAFLPLEYDFEMGALWKFDNDSIQEKRKLLKSIKLKDYTYETIGQCDCAGLQR